MARKETLYLVYRFPSALIFEDLLLISNAVELLGRRHDTSYVRFRPSNILFMSFTETAGSCGVYDV